MPNRFKEALLIQDGACNPIGIAKALDRACKEVLNEGGTQRDDPAVRLIVHQLAYLCNTAAIENDLGQTYHHLIEECRQRENEGREKTKGDIIREMFPDKVIDLPLVSVPVEDMRGIPLCTGEYELKFKFVKDINAVAGITHSPEVGTVLVNEDWFKHANIREQAAMLLHEVYHFRIACDLHSRSEKG